MGTWDSCVKPGYVFLPPSHHGTFPPLQGEGGPACLHPVRDSCAWWHPRRAQSKKDKGNLISVTLRVKTEDGIKHSGAKIWDATTLPVVDTNYRTDKNGDVTLKVHPQSTLIVGEYMIWDEKTNENAKIGGPEEPKVVTP